MSWGRHSDSLIFTCLFETKLQQCKHKNLQLISCSTIWSCYISTHVDSYQNSFSHQFQICKQIDFSKRRLDPGLETRNAAAGFFSKIRNTNLKSQEKITLTILTGKNCFTQFSGCLAASGLFHVFTQLIEFYTFFFFFSIKIRYTFKLTNIQQIR